MMVSRWIRLSLILTALIFVVAANAYPAEAWSPVPVVDDPKVRMPGTQPGEVTLAAPSTCVGCHGGYDEEVEPAHNWEGSMMAQAARDPLFWATMAVAAQDSIWAFGDPNAADICLRCHMPKGWLEERSDPTNGSAMTDADFDGVSCDLCHRMWNPFFESTHDGTREGNNFAALFDETDESGTPSNTAAMNTYNADAALTAAIKQFNGDDFFNGNVPANANYTENANGQYFISTAPHKRASFADAAAPHPFLYSRYHKSKYYCSTCHDVSNSVLANSKDNPANTLTSEANSAYSYAHVERTFSEFMLSDYGTPGGAPGKGDFRPDVFQTSDPDNHIESCQDCHMRDVSGRAAVQNSAIDRPTGSTEHPNSGQPLHDLTGGNAYIPRVLAATVLDVAEPNPTYNQALDDLLNRPAELTMNLTAGLGLDWKALLDGADRAEEMLRSAGRIERLDYDPCSGLVTFRVHNDTGHKLITGYPEGRRMWVNIRVLPESNAQPIFYINPYNTIVGTLKGMPDAPLGPNERYVDELVYEVQNQSSLTGEDHTFHFILSTERYKDNRIPPKGFDTAQMESRMSQPYHKGQPAPNYFTPAEYEGGYDEVAVLTVPGAGRVEVRLFYQTTSREYIQFLRDEINGDGDTLPGSGVDGDPAYLAQSDPFFAGLKDWGDTIWEMWNSTRNMPGNAPVLMAQGAVTTNRMVCSFLPSIAHD